MYVLFVFVFGWYIVGVISSYFLNKNYNIKFNKYTWKVVFGYGGLFGILTFLALIQDNIKRKRT